jgi:hypothetical protein
LSYEPVRLQPPSSNPFCYAPWFKISKSKISAS